MVKIIVEGGSIAEIIAALSGNSGPSIPVTFSAVPGATGYAVTLPGDDEDAPATGPAPDVDKSGIPWDERIHAKSKAIVADGTWRKRKGLDDATFNAVTAELRSRSAPPQFAMPTGPIPMLPPGMITQPVPQAFTPPPQSPPAPMPQVSTGTAPGDMITFGEFMPKFSAAMQSGKLQAAELPAIYQWQGISDLSQLAQSGEKLQQVYAWLLQNGKI